jgi:membrane protease YdiL (CAAX protease family)
MMPLAFILTDEARTQLSLYSVVLLQAFAAVSFVAVGRYALARLREGRLVGHEHRPAPIVMQGPAGWFYVLSVLALIFLQSVWYVVIVLVGILGVLMENGRTLREQFGLGRLGPVRILRWSVLGFGAVLLVETPLAPAVRLMLDQLNVPHESQESVRIFEQSHDMRILVLLTLQALLLPVIEELFFRGFLQTFLKGYTTTWVALIISSGLFAFAHVNLEAALPLWVLGLFLGLVYEHTGDLLLPIGIHCCWNFITALSLLADKGMS